MALTAIGDTVIIAPEPYETRTAGGLLVPEPENRRKYVGTVLSAGAGRRANNGALIPPGVEPGDRVLYDFAHVTVMPHHSGDVHITRPHGIFGTVDDD